MKTLFNNEQRKAQRLAKREAWYAERARIDEQERQARVEARSQLDGGDTDVLTKPGGYTAEDFDSTLWKKAQSRFTIWIQILQFAGIGLMVIWYFTSRDISDMSLFEFSQKVNEGWRVSFVLGESLGRLAPPSTYWMPELGLFCIIISAMVRYVYLHRRVTKLEEKLGYQVKIS